MAELGNLAKKSETDLGDPNDNECMDILATSEKKKKNAKTICFRSVIRAKAQIQFLEFC